MDNRDLIAFSLDNRFTINEKVEMVAEGKIDSNEYSKADEIINYCTNNDINIISIFDEEYPQSLKEVFAAPLVLYVLGTIPKIEKAITAVSYSNSANKKNIKKGIDVAVSNGNIFVSTLAPGFNSECSRRTINLNGKVVLVANRSIDYKLGRFSKEIVKHGAIISEYAPGITPNKKEVRNCNRIIIGLVNEAIVDKATNKSESYLFASEALANNKKVYVFGECEQKLIHNGAISISSVKDITL